MKQEDGQNSKSIQIQQQLQHKFPQKIPIPVQTTLANNMKINILQNITIPSDSPVSIDSNEQQKIESNNLSQKSFEKNLIQPSTSNDSLIPKSKPFLNNTKISQHITLKQVPSSSPNSNDIGKTLKVCPTKKTITTKSVGAGQKLIVVSNPQTITNPSILHRTLTIPFVKNLSMKNFDKFKIVNPTSSTIQLTPISNTITTNSTKHKVVTVRTNQAVKKVIPLSQLQVLNAKGGIKVLPIGGKIVTKSNVNATASPIYIVNTASNVPELTKSTPSTPVVMSYKLQETPSFEDSSQSNPGKTTETDIKPALGELMDSELLTPESGSYTDFESQITQHTIHHLAENELRPSAHIKLESAHIKLENPLASTVIKLETPNSVSIKSELEKPAERINLSKECLKNEGETDVESSRGNIKAENKVVDSKVSMLTCKTAISNFTTPDSPSFIDSSNSLIDTKNLMMDTKCFMMDSKSLVVDSRGSVIDARNSVIDARNSVIDARNSVIDARNSVIDASNSLIDAKSLVNDSNSSVIDSKRSLIDSKMFDSNNSVLDSKNSVIDSKSSSMEIKNSMMDANISTSNNKSLMQDWKTELKQEIIEKEIFNTDTNCLLQNDVNISSTSIDNNLDLPEFYVLGE